MQSSDRPDDEAIVNTCLFIYLFIYLLLLLLLFFIIVLVSYKVITVLVKLILKLEPSVFSSLPLVSYLVY